MQKVAQFFKVSFEQFSVDYISVFGETPNLKNIYDKISLPVRATAQSAGYDFFAPQAITLKAGETAKIPTGIRVKICDGWLLQLYPRSGLGFKYRLQLDNTVGIIDADYYNSDNEGHIFIKITNDTNQQKTVQIAQGEGFAQGVFTQFGITVDDSASQIRNGGFGSTT